MTDEQRRQLEELLVTRTVEGLDADESARLEALLRDAGEDFDAEWVDRLVGELDAAWESGGEENALSPALVASLVRAGHETIGASEPGPRLEVLEGGVGRDAARSSGSATKSTDVTRPTDATKSSEGGQGAFGRDRTRGRRVGALGWVGWAAAAVLALTWWSGREGSTVETVPTGFAELASLEGALVRPWTATEDPTAATASGEVVWVSDLQQGVMRFSGLEPNDPSRFQYQLWIFDAQRDERYPVDGGVFDVPVGAESVDVPIRAKLPVDRATLFAVTVEAPGGVVVSTRERIALVAQAEE